MKKRTKKLFSDGQREAYAVGVVFGASPVDVIETLRGSPPKVTLSNEKTRASKEAAGKNEMREKVVQVVRLVADWMATAVTLSLIISGVDDVCTKTCQILHQVMQYVESRLTE